MGNAYWQLLGEMLEQRYLLHGGSWDYGDAAIAGPAARHAIVAGLSLGTRIDAEPVAQNNRDASADDLQGIDDEEGVLIPAALTRGKTTSTSVFVTNETGRPARLQVWADFDGDGDWNDARDRVFAAYVDPGWNSVEFDTPHDAARGETQIRFRLSTSATDLEPAGDAPDGEVEDYVVEILRAAPDSIVFQDAGREWTVLRNGGANFVVDPWPEQYQRATWSPVATGDFTADGATDILGYQADGSWWILKNGGTRLVGAPWGRISLQVEWDTFHVADFDADGLVDIMGHESTGGTWWLWRNLGTSFESEYWARQTAKFTDFFLGDFNVDGAPDVLGRGPHGNWWLAQNVDGRFNSVHWGRYNAAIEWTDVLSGDFNGDRIPDSLARAADGTWWLWAGTTSGFLPGRYWGRWSTAATWADVLVEDFDGDGIDDVIGRQGNGDWVLSAGSEAGFVSRVWGHWNPQVNWSQVAVGRLDPDPLPDLVGQASDGTWWVARNSGSGFLNHYWGKSAVGTSTFGALLSDFVEPLPLESGLEPSDVQSRSYADYAGEVLDNLMLYGTDRYGTAESRLLMSAVDVRSRTSPPDLLPLDEANRVIRHGRRSPGGGNLYLDQPTLTAYQMWAEATGDPKYADFVTQNIAFTTSNRVDEQGLFWWGWHRFHDAYQESASGNRGNFHELQIQQPQWEALWQVDAAATTAEIEAIWDRHIVNKETGDNNRHDEHPTPPVAFAHSGGEYIYAFAFMYTKTGERVWLDRALLVENFFWSFRDPDTNLVPFVGSPDRRLFDAAHMHTGVTGMYARALLSTYELTGVDVFRDHAVAMLRAFAEYGFDEEAGTFWSSLALDGTPVAGPRLTADVEAKYEPRGHVDLWQPYASGKEFPLATAQAYALAYELTGDTELLLAAHRWAVLITAELPADSVQDQSWYSAYGRDWASDGTYAENYGRAISFLLHMEHLTEESRYATVARQVADEAIAQLYYKGLFRGHHRKPYHEAIDGVGYLLVALLQLAQSTDGSLTDFRNA